EAADWAQRMREEAALVDGQVAEIHAGNRASGVRSLRVRRPPRYFPRDEGADSGGREPGEQRRRARCHRCLVPASYRLAVGSAPVRATPAEIQASRAAR